MLSKINPNFMGKLNPRFFSKSEKFKQMQNDLSRAELKKSFQQQMSTFGVETSDFKNEAKTVEVMIREADNLHRYRLKSNQNLASQFIEEHSAEDIGKYFPVNRMLLPGRCAGKITDLWIRYGMSCMLLRPWMIELVKKFKKATDMTERGVSKKISCLALDGERGAGKSVAINYLMIYAVQKNCLVISIPHAQRPTRTPLKIFKSTDKDKVFYQPELCRHFFEHLIRTQSAPLSKIKLKKAYEFVPSNAPNLHNYASGEGNNSSQKEHAESGENSGESSKEREMSIEDYERRITENENTEEQLLSKKEEEVKQYDLLLKSMAEKASLGHQTGFGDSKAEKTLLNMAQFGADANKCLNPASLLYDFLDEVEMATEVPVLIAIDNLNYWLGESSFKGHDNKTLHATQLSFVDAFMPFLAGRRLKRGLVLTANNLSEYAFVPKGSSGMNIPAVYSEKEFETVLEHYRVMGVLQSSDDETFKRIDLLSGRSPAELDKIVGLF